MSSNDYSQIPKPKPPTKWDVFAKQKGIKNQKRSRMVFDEESQVRPHPLALLCVTTIVPCVGVETTMGIQECSTIATKMLSGETSG